MKSAADFAQRERVAVSELSRLSSDPALTFRPDPAFRAKFRNPDEIIEGDFNQVGTRAVATVPARRTCAALWRRSPKD